MDRTESTKVEVILRDELARSNRALRGVAPIISHMLETSGQTMVSDATVARLRGMLSDLARQLLGAGQRGGHPDLSDSAIVDQLADTLSEDPVLLNHLHALATEGLLTERLEHRSSIDPVLSPLVQELIASDQSSVAELAMKALAAQSRFMQTQRRMELNIAELPFELFRAALDALEGMQDTLGEEPVAQRVQALKANYDEGAGRLGLLARLVSAMRGGAIAALKLDHAGLALFATAIAAMTKQPRDIAILACHQRQAARLALSLRAAGLTSDAIERQFVLLEPAVLMPEGLGDMPSERAQALLSAGDVAGLHSGGGQVGGGQLGGGQVGGGA